MARSHRGVQLASFSWERAVPVKGPALGCRFWFAGVARSHRGVQPACFFVGTGHAREGFSAGVWALFAGVARSYRKVFRLLLVAMVTVG